MYAREIVLAVLITLGLWLGGIGFRGDSEGPIYRNPDDWEAPDPEPCVPPDCW